MFFNVAQDIIGITSYGLISCINFSNNCMLLQGVIMPIAAFIFIKVPLTVFRTISKGLITKKAVRVSLIRSLTTSQQTDANT